MLSVPPVRTMLESPTLHLPDISDSVGTGGHVVGAASEDNARVSDQDLLGSVHNRLEAGPAQPVH
jgi:hypothetical protein